MSQTNLVVAHFLDGRIVRGTTQDFFPTRPTFHVLPVDGSRGILVQLSLVKAVFFVKDLRGDADRIDVRGFLTAPPEATHGRKIAARFPDTELICGYAQSYSPNRDGFFVFPADAGSNNLRVFVVKASTVEIREGAEAEGLAQRVIDAEAA